MGDWISFFLDLSGDHRTTISLSSASEFWLASVSPSQDWLSSTGLLEPEEIDEEEPMVHSSLLSWRKSSFPRTESLYS
jgi:hypothetical protein